MIITLLRKPLEGTVAENTLKHGCGAINIDANRIPTDDPIGRKGLPHHKGPYSNKVVWSSSSTRQIDQTNRTDGRWPANFILTHLDGCELRGFKKVKGSVGKDSEGNEAKTGISMNNSTRGIHRVSHAGEDGKEDVADWACVEGCLVKELDQQSGSSRYFKQFKKGNK